MNYSKSLKPTHASKTAMGSKGERTVQVVSNNPSSAAAG